jgi:hypothetical protein
MLFVLGVGSFLLRGVYLLHYHSIVERILVLVQPLLVHHSYIYSQPPSRSAPLPAFSNKNATGKNR